MPNVQMPNGDVVAFPDDMPSEQIKGLIASKFPNEVAPTTPATQPAQTSQFDERAAQLQKVVADNASGAINPASAALQSFGTIAGGVNDIAGNALKAGASGLGNAAEFLMPNISKAVETGAGMVSDAASPYVVPVVKSALAQYGQFKRAHPEAAGNVEAIANLIGAAPIAKAGSLALSEVGNAAKVGAEATGSALKNSSVARGIGARSPEAIDEVVGGIKDQASTLYKQSRADGAILSPDKAASIADKIEKAVMDTGRLEEDLHGGTMKRLAGIREASKGEMSLEELDQQRRLLSGVINKNKISNPEDAHKATVALHALDDAVENLSAADVATGNTKAVESLLAGRDQWAKAKRIEKVGEIVKRAEGDPNRLKSLLKQFVDKKKNTQGFNSEELQALKEASRLSAPEAIMKSLGKFGVDFGTSLTAGNTALPVIGGIVSGGKLPVLGTIARQGQKYAARGKAENLLRVLEQRQSPVFKESTALPQVSEILTEGPTPWRDSALREQIRKNTKK